MIHLSAVLLILNHVVVAQSLPKDFEWSEDGVVTFNATKAVLFSDGKNIILYPYYILMEIYLKTTMYTFHILVSDLQQISGFL